jgi:flagellin
MRINSNIAAINASRNLLASNGYAGKPLEKSAAAYRTTRANADAAGLAISEGLRADIRGTTQAQRSAQEAISFVQTADGALADVHRLLDRLRDLAARSTEGDGAPPAQTQVDTLLTELREIGERTTFAGRPVFADGPDALAVHVDTGVQDALAAVHRRLVGDAGTPPALTLDLTTPSGAHAALAAIGAVFDDVADVRGTLGVAHDELEHTVATLGVAVENLSASESRISGADMAAEVVALTRAGILGQASTAVLAQASHAPDSILQLLQG